MVTDTWKCSPEEQNTSLRTWLHYQTLEKKTNVAWSMVEHNNITACISLDCLPQGDDAEAEEEEDIYVVVHNRMEQNRIRIVSLREMTQKQSRTPDYLHRFTRLQ